MYVIVIEDDPVIRQELVCLLENALYRVSALEDFKDPVSFVLTEDPDLVILDLNLPGKSGFDICSALRVSSDVPIVFVTGRTDCMDELNGILKGGDDYITKPFHPLIVKARVNTHIKLYRYRKQVEQQSMTDQLTGIANRRRYERYSIIKWQEATRLQVPFSICMLDIDHFKAYNDTFGHPAGDKVIEAIAKTLTFRLRRTTDFVARYGGEEFVAIILGGSAQSTFGHIKKVRQEIEKLHIPHASDVGKWVTVSIGGVTVIPKNDDDFTAFLKIADTMLYDAKRFGRNQVVWCDNKMRLWQEKPNKANAQSGTKQ